MLHRDRGLKAAKAIRWTTPTERGIISKMNAKNTEMSGRHVALNAFYLTRCKAGTSFWK